MPLIYKVKTSSNNIEYDFDVFEGKDLIASYHQIEAEVFKDDIEAGLKKENTS